MIMKSRLGFKKRRNSSKGGYTVDRRIETRSNGGVGDLIKREKLSFSLSTPIPLSKLS